MPARSLSLATSISGNVTSHHKSLMPLTLSLSSLTSKDSSRRLSAPPTSQTPHNLGPNQERSISVVATTNSNEKEAAITSRHPPSLLRKLSPGLAARMRLLDHTENNPTERPRRHSEIGKIPEDHIKELDSAHRDLSIRDERRGQAWHQAGSEKVEESASILQRGRPRLEHLLTPESDTTPLVDEASTGDDMPPARGARTMVEERPLTQIHTTDTPPSETDLQKYLKRSSREDGAPPPPPKDSPSSAVALKGDADSYFNPEGLSRTNSIFSFSRASFSSQLSNLTSLNLPEASNLAARIKSIPTATAAVKALTSAAEQIQRWTRKATDVLGSLDSEDDIEWAAAGGREGLDDVDKAVDKFETLVEVYVQAIEELQSRDDIADVQANDLQAVVEQMESTLHDWDKVRSLLQGVHEQVELAMEWEELWNVVLGDVGNEMDRLSRLIFEMEERRHKTMKADAENDSSNGLDINELETIVEDSPPTTRTPANYRFSLPPAFPASSPVASPATPMPHDDSTLLALFARMQPLRASLDFLPMRLSMFQARAEALFPTACEELEDKRSRLEAGWTKLNKDAEDLRRELGEDRWVLVFRNAGRQAQKMCESVERSITKLQEELESGAQHSNPPALAKKVESFEAKKMHYGPAIDRVLAIIQKGLNDRLTVNGEIIRLHTDMSAKARALTERMDSMESAVEEMNANRNAQLRDSISSIITTDRSATGSAVETPGSSPASSVVMTGGRPDPSTPGMSSSKNRGSTAPRPTTSKRYSGVPQPRNSSLSSAHSTRTASPSPGMRRSTATPTPANRPQRPAATPVSNKPRWNSSASTIDLVVGHHFKPLSSTTPSSYRKLPTPRSGASMDSHGIPSPLSRATSSSPAPNLIGPGHRTSHLASFSERIASPSPMRSTSLMDPPPYSKGHGSSPSSLLDPPKYSKSRSSMSNLTLPKVQTTPPPLTVKAHVPDALAALEGKTLVEEDTPPTPPPKPRPEARPVTALSSVGRRVSMLPQPKGRSPGRESSVAGHRPSNSGGGNRPGWK